MKTNLPRKMSGMVTLTVSLVILVAITLITIYTANTVSLENKIASNTNRSNIAFEAAEAGMEAATSYLSIDPDRDGNGDVDKVFELDADGFGTVNEKPVGTARVVVTVTDISVPPTLTAFRIISQGFSDDNSATRTITQIIRAINPLPNIPDNPMTTRGGVVITGSATVTNEEGHSTIWSGGDVDLGSNNATATNVADPGGAGYPACMDTSETCTTVSSSSRTSIGLDVIEHDSSLAALTPEEMFINFFGMPSATYRDSMVTVDTNNADVNTDADLAENEVIWVEGDANISGITVGCSVSINGSGNCYDNPAQTKPSILIVNGNLTTSGGPQFYGIVFVMGDIDTGGNNSIHGALVVAGETQSAAGGSLDIWYNSDILSGLERIGPLTGSSGSWRDF
jgi:hypothetical protein